MNDQTPTLLVLAAICCGCSVLSFFLGRIWQWNATRRPSRGIPPFHHAPPPAFRAQRPLFRAPNP
jgi:hypothetical protein